uniref:Intermembrane lipid transfer protein VPS13-like C-terminal domain-containing protein n=4 Tax=Clastoptera arizonana TaxID=38151 RepID=A0A1B6C7B3_9HEMI
MLGGVTSVFKQSYEGAANEGLSGFVSGIGKGLVGTVTKPVVGVLDFFSETASAVRDSSKSSSHQSPKRTRPPRCVTSPLGLLPVYSRKDSQGQEFLYSLNNRTYSEVFMAYETLRSGNDDLRIVISSELVRVFTCGPSNNSCSMVIEVHLRDLNSCIPLTMQDSSSTLHYIELSIRDVANQGLEAIKRPRVRCDNVNIANLVSQQINHARTMYTERQYTLVSTTDVIED